MDMLFAQYVTGSISKHVGLNCLFSGFVVDHLCVCVQSSSSAAECVNDQRGTWMCADDPLVLLTACPERALYLCKQLMFPMRILFRLTPWSRRTLCVALRFDTHSHTPCVWPSLAASRTEPLSHPDPLSSALTTCQHRSTCGSSSHSAPEHPWTFQLTAACQC